MSERTYTWAAQSIPDNRLPTSPSFFFSYLPFYDNAGEWIDVRGAVFTQPHPIVRSGRRMARPEDAPLLFLVVSAVVARRPIAFHFVTCLSRSWLVERLSRPSHSLYKRKDDECTRRVNREHGSITSRSACSR